MHAGNKQGDKATSSGKNGSPTKYPQTLPPAPPSGAHLIQHEEGGGAVRVDGEEQRERSDRLLAACELGAHWGRIEAGIDQDLLCSIQKPQRARGIDSKPPANKTQKAPNKTQKATPPLQKQTTPPPQPPPRPSPNPANHKRTAELLHLTEPLCGRHRHILDASLSFCYCFGGVGGVRGW